MKALLNQYLEAVEEFKQAERNYQEAEFEFIDVAILKLNYAKEKLNILHKQIREDERYGNAKEEIGETAWRNLARGIGVCY